MLETNGLYIKEEREDCIL